MRMRQRTSTVLTSGQLTLLSACYTRTLFYALMTIINQDYAPEEAAFGEAARSLPSDAIDVAGCNRNPPDRLRVQVAATAAPAVGNHRAGVSQNSVSALGGGVVEFAGVQLPGCAPLGGCSPGGCQAGLAADPACAGVPTSAGCRSQTPGEAPASLKNASSQ
ncbi:hypothetical protein BOX15_Mlig008607g1 [Macrostomum lignano]|uniref:Uncharacterized protein n=1 Tax=Macrostomum lignano TaxID=282301 RepID=A0A267GFA1_9PLAT|nr:hypothetical protein BOX15_Mlig008607g1 [Macrostomum lignano]